MNDFGIPSLDTDLIGCVSRAGYSYNRASSVDRMPALRGRARYRLRDSFPTYSVSVTIEMSAAQFSAFQSAWTGTLEHGNRPFSMRLMLTSLDAYEVNEEVYVVRALQPWTASALVNGYYTVSMLVEVPGDIAYVVTGCDVIYGGPITDLAADIVWAGEIDNLPPDIIEPCPGVLTP